MREIKFRAWRKDLSRMMYAGDIFTEGALPLLAILNNKTVSFVQEMAGDEGSSYWAMSLSDTPVMQYTGLTDKNGKEIYEGDIISNSTDNVVVNFGFYWTEDLRSGNGWYVLYNGFGISLINPNKSEVIGNIYENPELIV